MIKKRLLIFINKIVCFLGYLINNFSKSNNNEDRKLCILRTDAIGDLILFLPSLKYIRQKYFDYYIIFILQNRVSELVVHSPYIDEIIPFSPLKYRRNIFYKLKFLVELRKHSFDICLYPQFNRESIGDEICFWLRSKRKIAFYNKLFDNSDNNRSAYTKLLYHNFDSQVHEHLRNKYFLNHLNIETKDYQPEFWLSRDDKEYAEKLILNNNLSEKTIIAICPGKLTTYVGWEPDNFVQLMKKLNQKFPKAKFLIIGSIGESHLLKFNDDVLLKENVINLCGSTTLRTLAALFLRCHLVVGNDSGPIHIAIAVKARSVALLGGGHFGRFMPYGDPLKNHFVIKKMNCFNCDWKCKYSSNKCITEISVNDVYYKCENIMFID